MTETRPERTCVGCRRKRPQEDLIRLCVERGHVVPALGATPGRGAYLCPDPACLETAMKRRAFARSFRAAVAPDPDLGRRFATACEQRKAVR